MYGSAQQSACEFKICCFLFQLNKLISIEQRIKSTIQVIQFIHLFSQTMPLTFWQSRGEKKIKLAQKSHFIFFHFGKNRPWRIHKPKNKKVGPKEVSNT